MIAKLKEDAEKQKLDEENYNGVEENGEAGGGEVDTDNRMS